MNDPIGERIRVRKWKRTRRHRQNRSLRRAIFLAAVAGITLGLAVSFIPGDLGTYLASYLPSRNTRVRMADAGKELAAGPSSLDEIPDPPHARPVYPYSLVPGGVYDAKELEAAFAHDPVLASHYRGFDFNRARLVRLLSDKTVYVSYRIGGRIFWTTRLVHLHAGELLLTDGVMTVRTRCGNQVSENPRVEVSPNEPRVATLEKPIHFAEEPAAPKFVPVDFESSLHRPDFPSFYAPPPAPGLVGAMGGFGPVFPAAVCGLGKKKNNNNEPPDGMTENGKKKKGGPCGEGGGQPGTVPEPSSFILLSSGLGGLYVRYRFNRGSAK